MNKLKTLLPLVVLTLAAVSVRVGAQPPLPPGQRRPPAPPPGKEGWRRRENAKRQLGRTVMELGRLEKSRTPLNKLQAQRLTSLIRAWQNRPAMTQVQAKHLNISLNGVLTKAQKSAMSAHRVERRGERPEVRRGAGRPPRDGFGPPPPRDGFGPPPPRDGFDSPQMRAQRKKMRSFLETMNPLYPPTRYSQVKSLPAPMRQGIESRYQRTQQIIAALSRRAAGR